MNAFYITGAFLLALLLPLTLFASSVKLFFTNDELMEMGVRIEPSDSADPS